MLDTLSKDVIGIISVLQNHMRLSTLNPTKRRPGRARAARGGVAMTGHSAWNLAGFVRARGVQSGRSYVDILIASWEFVSI